MPALDKIDQDNGRSKDEAFVIVRGRGHGNERESRGSRGSLDCGGESAVWLVGKSPGFHEVRHFVRWHQ